MKRFWGMMPSSEIEITKEFKDRNGLCITIEAGPHGYTITYADHSTKYADIDNTSEENFKIAKDIIDSEFNNLIEIK